MKTNHIQTQKLLRNLQNSLQQLQCWEDSAPSMEALSSSMPFALDTLKPEQWLQWVFIPRMNQLIESEQALPSGFAITPYFDEVWKEQPQRMSLIELLKQIDEVCQ